MNWLDLLIRETDFVETPKQWLYWSGLATISAIISPNVYVNKKAYRLRPNLFILLVGRSGLGKGFGPSVSRKIVTLVNNTRVISGRGSIEGIIHELSITKAGKDGSIPFKDARGYLVSGEFAATMYESSKALTVLTDLYDGHYNPQWDNTLKNSPVESLRAPCLTLLSGANQEMFDLAVDKSHKGGGFVGRTLLIGAEKRHKSNSMIFNEDEEDEVADVNYDRLAEYPKKLAKLEGPMKWSRPAISAYNKWFYPYREAEVDDKTGTYDRLNDHVIKVATCISVARKPDMIIEEEDVEDAIISCSKLSSTARQVAGMEGKSAGSAHIKSFLLIMFQAPNYTMSRKQILQKGFGDFDASELDKIIETLSQTGFIVQSGGDKEIIYKMTKQCIDWWEKSTKASK